MVFVIHWQESAMVLHVFPTPIPLPPPSPPDPSGSSQYTRSEHLSHASNLGWWSVFTCNVLGKQAHFWFHLQNTHKYYFSFEKKVKRNIFYSKSSFPKLYPWPQCKLGWEFSHQYLRSTILRLKLNSWPKHLRLSPFKLTWNQVKSSGASLVAQW